MSNKTEDEDRSPQEGHSTWNAVFITEFIVIFIINAFTLVAFARNRHLRKRSTCLIINLTVADLLVAVVAGPLDKFVPDIEPGQGYSWRAFINISLSQLFPVASQANLSLISLERLHATLYPFRHSLIQQRAYCKIIICSWLSSFLLAYSMFHFHVIETDPPCRYTWASYIILTLLVIASSYVIIILNVKSNPHSQHFGSVSSDRKLTVTLFIVTVFSFLTILPWAICAVIADNTPQTLNVLYYANSIVNPLIYAIRMQEFRKGVKELICKKTPEPNCIKPVELYTL